MAKQVLYTFKRLTTGKLWNDNVEGNLIIQPWSLQFPHAQVWGCFLMDRISHSGWVMTQKHLWRFGYSIFHQTALLMILSIQVCLAAIKSPVLDDMVECVHGFVECCYIARCNAITASDLNTFKQHLEQFHQLQNVLIETGVHASISMSTCADALHIQNQTICILKWCVFLNYGINPHQCCQRTLAM